MKNLFLFAAMALASAAQAQNQPSAVLDAQAVVSARTPSSPGALADAAPHAEPEFEKATAIAGLTLLLGGIAILKGWRRT